MAESVHYVRQMILQVVIQVTTIPLGVWGTMAGLASRSGSSVVIRKLSMTVIVSSCGGVTVSQLKRSRAVRRAGSGTKVVEDGEDPAVLLGGLVQAELFEDAAHVAFDG